MASFINPFPGMRAPRELDKNELVRALRQNMAAELEAVHLYDAIRDSTPNLLAKKVLQNISDEERLHMGEFLRLIEMVNGDEGEFVLQGAKEVDVELQQLGPGQRQQFVSPTFNVLDPLGLMDAVKQDIPRMGAAASRLIPQSAPGGK